MTSVNREFQVYADLGGSFRVRVVDTSNGKRLWASEAYYDHYNAMRFAQREASLQIDGGRVVDLSSKQERSKKRSWFDKLFG